MNLQVHLVFEAQACSHSTRHSAATTLQQEVHERRLVTSAQLGARPEERQRTPRED